MSIKRCARCREFKSLDHFSRRKQANDGLHPYCKECDSAYKKSKYAYIAPPLRGCAWCGDQFQPKQRHGIYCCVKCKDSAKSQKQSDRVAEGKIGRVCRCGEDISGRRGDAKFCSERCRRQEKYPERIHKKRAYELRTKYGITPEQYQGMLQEQEGKCGICLNVGKLNVDHCHETSKVRGLLCDNCNQALGKFKDDLNILERAANYLRAARV